MSPEITLIILCTLVIFSYLFDIIARQFKIPAVILLLLSGIGLRYLSTWLHLDGLDFTTILPVLGTIGLILIVLEGALELKLEREKLKLIKQAFSSAFFILLLTSFGIALFFQYLTGQSFRICFLNAIPLGVISSAIAIPSASALTGERKDFIVYESSLSDIFGIVMFNFMITNQTINGYAFAKLGWETILILVLSGLFCLGLLYLLKRITLHLKFFLIIAVLILVYAIGKHYHLPTLIIVLVFGLFLNNLFWIRHPWFMKNFRYDNFYNDLKQLTQLSGESAFIVRTFFFLIFGFTLNVETLLKWDILINGIVIVFIIYLIRIGFQKIFVPAASVAEYFLSPRGLISILLFFSIPVDQTLAGIENAVLFFVILATSIIMTLGLVATRSPKSNPANP